MTDWTSAEGRTKLRQLLTAMELADQPGPMDRRIPMSHRIGEVATVTAATIVAALPLLDALGAAERERDEVLVALNAADIAVVVALEAAAAREAKLREALHALLSVHPGEFGPPDTQTCPHDRRRNVCGLCDDEAVQNARDALALPADDTALAEARREGARACVEAARETLHQYDDCLDPCSGEAVMEAVERAAANLEGAR